MYAPGTNQGHGHVWKRPDGLKARCGGPGPCQKCAVDLADKNTAQERQMICPECDRVCAPLATADAKVMSGRLYRVPTTSDEHAKTIIDAADLLLSQSHRIERLKAAIRRINDAATDAGNDERHTAGERTGARGVGAIIRREMTALGL